MNFCRTCGERADEGQGVCTSCGAPLGRRGPGHATPRAVGGTDVGRSTGSRAPATVGGADPQDGPPVARPAPAPGEQRRRVSPVAICAVILAAVVGGVGYTVADRLSEPGESSTSENATGAAAAGEVTAGEAETSEATPADTAVPSSPSPSPPPPPTTVPIPAPLVPLSATADCVAPPAVDSAGATVTYEPERLFDGDPVTAWRCPGSAVGTQLTFAFGDTMTVTSLALVPGYDKIDPLDGIDRFTENRTVTAVVWRLDDGSSYRQEIPSPGRSLAEFALPSPVDTSSVTLEIAATGNDGARRDYTPISEVRIQGY